MSELREDIQALLVRSWERRYSVKASEIMAVVAPIVSARDAAVERAERLALELADAVNQQARDFVNLAAVRQQLDQVRDESRRLLEERLDILALHDELRDRHKHCITGYRVHDDQDTDSDCAHCIAADLHDILGQRRDAPARPAGHDESGQ